MKRWFDRLEKLYRVVGLICFVALTAIVGWQVFARYVLNDSPSWSEPLAMLLLLYAVLLGAAVGVRRDFHLGLRWLYQKLNPRFRRLADRMTLLVISGFGAGMVAIMVWRPRGLLAHRDPTIRLNDGKGRGP